MFGVVKGNRCNVEWSLLIYDGPNRNGKYSEQLVIVLMGMAHGPIMTWERRYSKILIKSIVSDESVVLGEFGR